MPSCAPTVPAPMGLCGVHVCLCVVCIYGYVCACAACVLLHGRDREY